MTSIQTSTARLLAVQTLYSKEITDENISEDLVNFCCENINEKSASIDKTFFRKLIRETSEKEKEIDVIIENSLDGDWTINSLEILIKIILRTAVCELLRNEKPQIIISEYVTIASAFFDESKIGFVNAILEKITRSI